MAYIVHSTIFKFDFQIVFEHAVHESVVLPASVHGAEHVLEPGRHGGGVLLHHDRLAIHHLHSTLGWTWGLKVEKSQTVKRRDKKFPQDLRFFCKSLLLHPEQNLVLRTFMTKMTANDFDFHSKKVKYLKQLSPDRKVTFLGIFLPNIGFLDIPQPQFFSSPFEKLQSRQTRSNIILRLFAKRRQS